MPLSMAVPLNSGLGELDSNAVGGPGAPLDRGVLLSNCIAAVNGKDAGNLM